MVISPPVKINKTMAASLGLGRLGHLIRPRVWLGLVWAARRNAVQWVAGYGGPGRAYAETREGQRRRSSSTWIRIRIKEQTGSGWARHVGGRNGMGPWDGGMDLSDGPACCSHWWSWCQAYPRSVHLKSIFFRIKFIFGPLNTCYGLILTLNSKTV